MEIDKPTQKNTSWLNMGCPIARTNREFTNMAASSANKHQVALPKRYQGT
jgi:hypothetical protein